MCYGAIDIGTNSCRLLIAEPGPASGLNTLARELQTTRIGSGVNVNKKINRDAMDKTLDCLGWFANLLRDNQVESYRVVATSAVREANNRRRPGSNAWLYGCREGIARYHLTAGS